MTYKDRFADYIGPGTDFPVVQATDRHGRNIRRFDREPRTLADVFRSSRDFGDRIAIRYLDESWTFTQQWDEVARLASAFAADYGIAPGDRVAIAMRNFPEWCFAFWAGQMLGATVVSLNAWLTGPELHDLIARSAPKLVIADAERATALVSVPGNTVPILCVRADTEIDGTRDYSKVIGAAAARMPEVDVDPESLATILFTSGTTSQPKGVPATHSNHINNMYLLHLRDVAGRGGAPESDCPPPTLVVWPFFHVSGHSYIYWCAFAGRTALLIHKWNVREALSLIRRHGVTSISGPPLTTRQLVDELAQDDAPVPLKTISWGGAHAPARMAADIFSVRGGQIQPSTGYGSTEATSTVAANAGPELMERPGSIGRPLPGFEVRIVDEAGNDVPSGEPGELWLRGASMVTEYLDDPAATAASFVDGWFRTGDQVTQDSDGFLSIIGRFKDVVIRGGENVSAPEVESIIGAHPAIEDVAVLGFPHRELGEEVGAIVRTQDSTLDADALRTWVRGRTAAFKVPSIVRFTKEPLPRNATGKLDKAVLRKQLGIVPSAINERIES